MRYVGEVQHMIFLPFAAEAPPRRSFFVPPQGHPPVGKHLVGKHPVLDILMGTRPILRRGLCGEDLKKPLAVFALLHAEPASAIKRVCSHWASKAAQPLLYLPIVYSKVTVVNRPSVRCIRVLIYST